jgi:hypothetical protein
MLPCCRRISSVGQDLLLGGHPAPESPPVAPRAHPLGSGLGPAGSAPVPVLQRLQIGGAASGLATSGSVQLPKLGRAVGGSGNLSHLAGNR